MPKESWPGQLLQFRHSTFASAAPQDTEMSQLRVSTLGFAFPRTAKLDASYIGDVLTPILCGQEFFLPWSLNSLNERFIFELMQYTLSTPAPAPDARYAVRWLNPLTGSNGEWLCATADEAIEGAREAAFDAGPAGAAYAWSLKSDRPIAAFEGANELDLATGEVCS